MFKWWHARDYLYNRRKNGNNDIKKILNSGATPIGKWLSIGTIQNIISSNYLLQQDDLASHTKTRPTTYPVWKHRIQGVVSDLKTNGLIAHDPITESYKF